MQTIWDWLTVFIFAGLITLFLSRSVDAEHGDDRLFHYLVPSAGCAFANWLGNEGQGLAAGLLILLILGYVRRFLFHRPHQPPAP